MRITGGELKSRIIPANFANHVRPSTDRVRESLFNTVNHQKGIQDAQVLDLFSGSGIIALEFLSRGAAQVISIDKDKKNIFHQKHIKQSWELRSWSIVTGDALSVEKTLEKSGQPLPEFDIIFADPPYDMPNIQGLVSILMPLLADQGWLIVEHKPQLVFAEQELLKKEYGSTTMTIFAKP
jgi:16S rRNA (guanine966-N2)-methyltransferase